MPRYGRGVRLAFAALLVVLVSLAPRRAEADEVAPALETADLRTKAQAELRNLWNALPTSDRRRLAGMYVAFDADAADPFAQVACDDDGDDVVVMSDAMLRLAADVARGASLDEANGTRKLEEHAGYLARTQVPGRRLLPPAAGFYTATKAGATEDERLREILAFLVARELVHFRTGDLACPHPTATKESGDDAWTAAERRRARETAASVYPGRFAERDGEAVARLLEANVAEKGALALLRFFAQFEAERTSAMGAFLPTYLRDHPSSAARAGVVTQAAAAAKRP